VLPSSPTRKSSLYVRELVLQEYLDFDVGVAASGVRQIITAIDENVLRLSNRLPQENSDCLGKFDTSVARKCAHENTIRGT